MCTKIKIIWCTVPEIQSETDRIFCHFDPFFAYFTNLHHKWQSYDILFLRYGARDIIFCHSGPFFALLPPYGQRKSKFWKNEKNTWIYYHFTSVYLNDSHMMYGSWDMECNGQNFLSFWTVFCPLTPFITRKIKILKKWKNLQEILSFYICVP